jgi:hypothetical protein
MGKVFMWRFSDYCRENKKKGYFYQGDAREKTIYGKAGDREYAERVMKTKYNCEDINESGFRLVDTSKFSWYSLYLPRLESIFLNPQRYLEIQKNWDGGNHRTLYQLNCKKLGIELMTNVFSSHAELLESAIGLCRQSLTSKDWQTYLHTWHAKMKAFAKNDPRIINGSSPDTKDNAWYGCKGRPTKLLSDKAIEVHIQKLVTYAVADNQEFHVDGDRSCFTDDDADDSGSKRLNYGTVTMILPGSDSPDDQVSTEISGKGRDWEHNGAGIWLPTNVLHRGRKPDNARDRHVYLIEVHSNGNFLVQNGDHGHQCKDVKAFRMTLTQLEDIKNRQMGGCLGGHLGGYLVTGGFPHTAGQNRYQNRYLVRDVRAAVR